MGIYLNPGNYGFAESLRSEIYVDKTGLISYTNKVLNSRQKFVCISRPRRFGKTMAAEMLIAYYSCGCDSREMFQGLEIAKHPSFDKHLNQYNVIFFNMQDFLSMASGNIHEMLRYFQEEILLELKEHYPDIINSEETRLVPALNRIFKESKKGFIFIVDEWDCIFREKKDDSDAQKDYLDFLRTLWKDKPYVNLVYMTGILPVKKYGTHSALNMFSEFSMTSPKRLAEYVGFTEDEVQKLCTQFNMDFEETKRWYDGYQFRSTAHVYSPKSVVDAMLNEEFGSYWTQTETYEALRVYIDMNYDELKDAVIQMIGGERVKINPAHFTNDMTTFKTKDDVLTLLIHLGYLGYDAEKQQVFIPNEEVRGEFVNAVEVSNWQEVMRSITASESLLESTLNGDIEAVAAGTVISKRNDTTKRIFIVI